MEFVTVDDIDIPALGFGTWLMEGADCHDGVAHALSIGYRHIDTAQIYDNEDQVGCAIDESSVARDDIFLTTKVWRSNVAADDVAPSVEESLRKLRTDYVDLLLIHWPSDTVDHDETLRALQKLKDAGKTRLIGVSNFTPAMVREALQVTDIACNQVEYHPFLGQPDLLELARANDMMLTAYSPLARGRVIDDPTLIDIGDRYDKSPAQIALRWLTQQQCVSAIPKASTPAHREANFQIFDFQLDSDEMQRIHDLDAKQRILDPDFAPDWER